MYEFGLFFPDIDECEDGTHRCSGGQECVNRPGDYLCQCPTGYRLNSQRQCEDINECQFYFGAVSIYNLEKLYEFWSKIQFLKKL